MNLSLSNFCTVVSLFCLVCNNVNNFVLGWEGRLVFDDEFSNTYLRTDRWEYDDDCLGKGGSLECYQRGKNIYVENGTLTIRTRIDIVDDRKNTPYTSGKIRTQGTDGFSYGTYVVRARMPKGKHLRPSIWIQPVRQDIDICRYEEISILEYRGQRTSSLTFSAYYGRNYSASTVRQYEKVFRGVDLSQGFHEFALRWLPTKLQWFVDGQKTYEMTTHFINDWTAEDASKIPCDHDLRKSFSQDSHLVISLNVGGSAFSHPKYGNLTRLQAMEWPKPTLDIDYVRIYQDY